MITSFFSLPSLKRITTYLLLILPFIPVFSQKNPTDSLENLLKKTARSDVQYVEIINQLASANFYLDTEKAVEWAEEALDISKDKKWQKEEANAQKILGITSAVKGDMKDALFHFQESIKIAERNNFEKIISGGYHNLVGVYLYYFDEEKENTAKTIYLSKAMDAQKKSFFYKKRINNPNEIAHAYSGIGGIFLKQADLEKDSIILREVLDSAFYYNYKAYNLATQEGNRFLEGISSLNISLTLYKQDRYEEAAKFAEIALNIAKEGNAYIHTHALLCMADIRNRQKKEVIAEEYYKSAIVHSRKAELKHIEVEALKKMISLLNKKNRGVEANQYFERYEAVQQKLNDQIQAMTTQLKTEKEEQKNIYLVNENNLLQSVNQSYTFIVGGLVAALLLGVFFMSYLWRQRQTIKTQNLQLTQANETKNQFFSIIAHDLRGPVLSFQNLSKKIYYLDKKGEEGDVDKMLEQVDFAANNLNSLLDNLLNWSLVEGNTFPYQPAKINLKDLSNEIYGLFKPLADSKGVKLKQHIFSDFIVLADRNSLSTILRNLVSNAIKFSHHGDEVVISAKNKKENILLRVEDTGQGIPVKIQKELFLLNQEKVREGTYGEKGTGLGLVLCEKFTKLNGGKIELLSQVGKGTLFTVTLPRM